MDFATLPPEINSARMYAGPGAGPMLAAAAAWDALAAELQSTAASYRAAISELTGGPWLGASSAEMTAATTPYLDWMTTAAAQAEQTATQARATAAAYETAFAMTVPPVVIAANRSLLMTLIATNVLGQNTAAIAATEVQYAEMWAQDATAMYGYAGSAATASTLTPFAPPPPTTNPAGGIAQAAAATQSVVSNGSRVLTTIPQALQGLATAAAPAALDPTTLLPLVTVPFSATAVTTGTIGISTSLIGLGTTVRALLINADRDFALGKGPFTGNGVGGMMLPEWIINGTGGIGAPSDAVPDSSGGLGRAEKIGRLSVPSAWTVAAPEIRPSAFTLPITSAAAAPEVGGAGNLFSSMGLAGAAGGAVGSTASAGRGNERVRITPRPSPTPSPQPPQDAVAAIATELQELATRAQSLLSTLAQSGLLTTEEVTEQKRRFLG